jgi:transcriptional regulator with XRE-family HTH domain
MRQFGKELSKTMTKLRKEQKLTMIEVIKRTGLSTYAMRRIEVFRVTPELRNIEKIAHAFGLRLWELLKVMEEEEAEKVRNTFNKRMLSNLKGDICDD